MYKIVYVNNFNDYNRFIYDNFHSKVPNVFCNVRPILRQKSMWQFLYKLQENPKTKGVFPMPFKSVWAGQYLDKHTKAKLSREDNIIFIFTGSIEIEEKTRLFSYWKNKYPNCKLVYLFGDTVALHLTYPGFTMEKIKSIFDMVATYNRLDAEEYGLCLTPIQVMDYGLLPGSDCEPESDVFFVGREKGRLEQLLYVFETCKKHGLRCDFHIVGVEESRQKYADEITYNCKMTYQEVIRHTQKTRCVLNIIQGGVVGVTLRDYEAIGMNKFLMTDNPALEISELYTPEKVIRLDHLEEDLSKLCLENEQKTWNQVEKYSTANYFKWFEAQFE